MKLSGHGRWATFAGLTVASATTLLVTMAGPAMADDQNDNDGNTNGGGSSSSDTNGTEQATTCTDQVRVRSQPSPTAPVVGSCAKGEKVTVDKTENGFGYLVSKKGWASTDYLGLDKDKKPGDKPGGGGDDRRDPGAGGAGGLLGGGL